VKHSVPLRKLPERPALDQFRRQAKELLAGCLAGEPVAFAQVDAFYPGRAADQLALHHAQLVLARSYGFESWPKLKAYVDGVTMERLIAAVRGGDVKQVRALIRLRPELVNRAMPSSDGETLLHLAVQGRMPELVQALMQGGAGPRARTAGIYSLRDAASPLLMARERGYQEIVGSIREEEKRREVGPPKDDRSIGALWRQAERFNGGPLPARGSGAATSGAVRE